MNQIIPTNDVQNIFTEKIFGISTITFSKANTFLIISYEFPSEVLFRADNFFGENFTNLKNNALT